MEQKFEALRELMMQEPENTQAIRLLVDELHPIDIAHWLTEQKEEIIRRLFDQIEAWQGAEILEQMDEGQQAGLIRLLQDELVLELFSYMSKDDIADILGTLPIGKRKSLMQRMKKSDSQVLQSLLGYKEDSAGGIMTTEYIAFSGEITAEQALAKIREIAPVTEVIDRIYIINGERKLTGVADLRDILVAKADERLSTMADTNVISVYPEEDQERVAHLVSKYDLIAIPVVNRNQAILGIITVDDIIDVMVEEQTEDILRIGGASSEEKIGGPVLLSIRRRLPWLVLNLVTAFLAALTISAFESVIAQVAALASAMTIISGMGGNAGTQTMSLVLRAITLGKIEMRKDWYIVFKEILLGMIDGAVIGLVTGLVLAMKYGNAYLGLIVLIAMIGNLIVAGIFGFLIPLAVKAVGADPALSSSIFLTTATDVLGFFIFLGLATIFLPYLTV